MCVYVSGAWLLEKNGLIQIVAIFLRSLRHPTSPSFLRPVGDRAVRVAQAVTRELGMRFCAARTYLRRPVLVGANQDRGRVLRDET